MSGSPTVIPVRVHSGSCTRARSSLSKVRDALRCHVNEARLSVRSGMKSLSRESGTGSACVCLFNHTSADIQERVPFNQNFRFEFPATSSSEWNSIFRLTAPVMTIFRHFQKRGQPLEVYPNFSKNIPGSFLSILLCSRKF